MAETTTPDNDDLQLLERSTAYRGYFAIERLTLQHRRHDGGWTEPYVREVFERGHAVAILPYDPALDRVVLIEQLRAPYMLGGADPRQIEVPAGIIEPGEAPEAVARRELEEETGLTCRSLQPLLHWFTSPGGSSETMRLYLALIDSRNADGHHGLAEEHEEIRVLAMAAQEAFRLVGEGKIVNATALLSLQWLELNRQHLRAVAPDGRLPPDPAGR